MENNDYYESTIKTTRNERYDLLRYAYEDLKSMDNVKIEKMKRDSKILKLQQEKQQLISFLEDKIKNITNYAVSFGLFIDKDISHEIDIKKHIYQEVLDFINKGVKDE